MRADAAPGAARAYLGAPRADLELRRERPPCRFALPLALPLALPHCKAATFSPAAPAAATPRPCDLSDGEVLILQIPHPQLRASAAGVGHTGRTPAALQVLALARRCKAPGARGSTAAAISGVGGAKRLSPLARAQRGPPLAPLARRESARERGARPRQHPALREACV